MRNILGALLIVIGSVSWAQEEDIQATITGQIEAFGEDDFETAFSYASPTIQMLFGNPQRFEMMVRNGYPMVINPSELTYMPLPKWQISRFAMRRLKILAVNLVQRVDISI